MDRDTLIRMLDIATAADPAEGARLGLELLAGWDGIVDARLFVRDGRGFSLVGATGDLTEANEELSGICDLVLAGDDALPPGTAPGELEPYWMLPLRSGGRDTGVLVIRRDGSDAPSVLGPARMMAVTAERLAAAGERQEAERMIERVRSYLPPEVVEQLRLSATGEVPLGGVQARAVVIFVDLCGYTAMSERMAPEQVVTLLNDFFAELHEVVHDRGGRIDKHLGDGALLVFAPEWAEAALDCVRRALSAVVMILRRFPPGGGPTVHLGATYGDVVVGNVGSARRYELTTIGDPVNLASRLLGHAEAGHIAVDQALERAVRDLNRTGSLVPLVVSERKIRHIRGRTGTEAVAILRPRA